MMECPICGNEDIEIILGRYYCPECQSRWIYKKYKIEAKAE